MTIMADQVNRICDELRVCREQAICYLEGSQENLDSAFDACRSQTLSLPMQSLKHESPPMNEKSPLNAPYKPPTVIDSRWSLNPSDEQSKNQRIKLFCETATGTNLEEACAYLERSDWDVNLAVDCFFDERRPPPSRKKSNPQKFSNVQSYLQDVPLKLFPSTSQFHSYLKPFEFGNSSSEYG